MANARRLARFTRIKRLIDVGLLVMTAPVTLPLAVVTAVVVVLTMGRPVVYRQPRIGWKQQEFTVLKFRTMNDRRDGSGELLPDRERLTRTGGWLRKLSLDELPQLVNVARGEMSLVGPRPLFTRYLPFYSAQERHRHAVRPGITGLAQVSGRNAVAWNQRLALDAEYADRASLVLDAAIIIKTFRQVLGSEGVAVIAGDSGPPLDVARAFPASERVRVVPFSEEDVATRVAWVSHARTREYMRWPDSITLESTREWFDRTRHDPTRLDFTVWDRQSDRRVAMAGLKETDADGGEFYVFTDPDLAGRGYGTETSTLLVNWALDSGRFGRVCLTVDADNAAALSIYRRLGFVVTRETVDRVWMEVSASGRPISSHRKPGSTMA